MSTNFPTSDGARELWFRNFALTIAQHAARYRLAPGDAAKLSQHAAEYERIFALAQSPGTRSPAVIEEKNRIRAAADTVFREYANRIKWHLHDRKVATAISTHYRFVKKGEQRCRTDGAHIMRK